MRRHFSKPKISLDQHYITREEYKSTSSGTEVGYVTLGNVTSYTNTGLTGGTTYFYQVKAVNSVGISPASNEASATP